MDRRTRLVNKLKNKEYRDAFVASQAKVSLAFQIRYLRKERNWSQEDLARNMGVSQGWIAQLEDPSYGSYSSKTLRKLASVFDVALIQRFAPFTELVDWSETLSEGKLCPSSFNEEGLRKGKD